MCCVQTLPRDPFLRFHSSCSCMQMSPVLRCTPSSPARLCLGLLQSPGGKWTPSQTPFTELLRENLQICRLTLSQIVCLWASASCHTDLKQTYEISFSLRPLFSKISVLPELSVTRSGSLSHAGSGGTAAYRELAHLVTSMGSGLCSYPGPAMHTCVDLLLSLLVTRL